MTEAEEYLMELKPLKPGEKVSEQWLGAALDLVNKEVVAGQGKVNKVKTGVDQARVGWPVILFFTKIMLSCNIVVRFISLISS